jgi:hypothetical protein
MAQTEIYSCGFDSPPYTVGTIDLQQSWTTAQATAIVAVPEMSVVSSGGPGAQAGNGFFSSVSGIDATTSGRFAFQAADYPEVGVNGPIIEAIRAAQTSGASSIEFSVYVTAPTPSFVGTTAVPARHNMILYVTDPTGTNSSFKACCGFSIRANTREVALVQWLDVGQLNATTAGNYFITFLTPLILPETGYTQVSCRWNRSSGMPSIKVGAGEWNDGLLASTVNYTAEEFDIANTRNGGTVSTQAYMDSLIFAASLPAYPQCTSTAGDCDTAHPSGGCNISSCCETVCSLDPSCCEVSWNQDCVNLAIPACELFVYACTSPGTPANNCATSPSVVTLPALVAYNTTTATTDGPPEPLCNSSDNDTQVHKDVWYRFQAATSGTLIASNCNTSTAGGSGDFDSKIAAYDIGTSLAAFDPQLLPDYFLGCNEDCDDPLFTSELVVSGIVQGNFYLVRLGGFAGASGSGNISIAIAPPPSPCDPAFLIQGVAGNNLVTTNALFPDLNMQTYCNFAFGSQNIAKAQFIKFTPTVSGAMTVSTCADTGTTVDSRLAVMTTCGDVATTIGCDDDGCTAGAAPYTSTLTVNVSAGQPVYIAVGGYDATETGPFNVLIEPPTAPLCPADLNDDNVVNGADLGLLLGSWGVCPGCPADLNNDGIVNGADLGLMLGSWGPCPV